MEEKKEEQKKTEKAKAKTNNKEKKSKAVEGRVIHEKEAKNIPNEKVYDKVLNFVKTYKKIICLAIIIIVALIVLGNVASVSPEEVVKNFVKELDGGHSEKAFSYVDWTGYAVFSNLSENEYDEYYDEYKDTKDDENIQKAADYMTDYFDEDFFDEIDDNIKDSEYSIKVKKIIRTRKLSKNLYKVVAKLETTDGDDDKDTNNYDFYVIKKGSKSYLVSFPTTIYNDIY